MRKINQIYLTMKNTNRNINFFINSDAKIKSIFIKCNSFVDIKISYL